MIDFDVARSEAFEIIKNTRNIKEVSEEVKNSTGRRITNKYWLVDVEVPVKEEIIVFVLEVFLKTDFPLSLPEIKLSEVDYNQTKYLPHVDSSRGICLFDQESIKQNIADPAGIVNHCINQAVRILADGLSENRLAEFNDEIVAYWENSYHRNDKVYPGYIGSNMDRLTPGKISAYFLNPSHAGVNLYVGNEETESKRLTSFFKMSGHSVQDLEALYLGELEDISPPFHFTNKTVLEFIQRCFSGLSSDTNVYLNANGHLNKLIFFSVVSAGQSVFFGFYLPPLKVPLKGWRSGHYSTVQIMTRIIPSEAITRIRFIKFHPSRLRARTDGKVQIPSAKKFMLAGLGSIGSNLLFYLNSLEVSNYLLIDPDTLTLENVNRHLLTFGDIGYKKVDVISKYLLNNNPFLEIKKSAESVVDTIKKNLADINEMDMIFCSIGKDVLESYILQYLANGIIQKPVCFFWVEPYLIGGHVLYINPNTTFQLSDLEVDGFYKFNILSSNTYNDPSKEVSLREAGCQGSYMPYGKAEISRFFSKLVPYLFEIIQTPPSKNTVITYAGDLNIASTLNLSISLFANEMASYQLIIKTI